MSQFIQTPPTPPQFGAPATFKARPTRHGLAIPTLILGIIGALFFPIGIIALILGIIAFIGIKNSNGTKTGTGMVITGIIFALIGFIFVVIAFMNPTDPLPTGKSVTPEATLAIAEANIVSKRDGTAYSNSEEGLKLAKEFNNLFQEVALEATDDLEAKHKFVTHCQLHGDSVAFIVHVPKLRKFEKESKERFCEFAWLVATSTLAQHSEIPLKTELAVAVKGNVLYQNMYFGEYQLPSEEGQPQGINAKKKDKPLLETFFKGPPAKEETAETTEVEETAQ